VGEMAEILRLFSISSENSVHTGADPVSVVTPYKPQRLCGHITSSDSNNELT